MVSAPPSKPPPPPPPSNRLRFGKPHRDKLHGIVRLRVSVPAPGLLLLRGKSVQAMKRAIAKPGAVTLVIRPKHRAMKTLRRRGHLRVGVKITFRPDGGAARTFARQLALVRKGQ